MENKYKIEITFQQTSLLVDDELEDCKQETDNLCDTTTTLAAGINDTWRLFCEFEDQAFVQAQNSKQQHQTFSDFVELWLARLDGVRQLGLHYPEKVLALKLVKQAGLDDESQRCVLAVLHTYMLLPDHRDLLQAHCQSFTWIIQYALVYFITQGSLQMWSISRAILVPNSIPYLSS